MTAVVWLTHLRTEKTRAILPIARILLRITSFLKLAAAPATFHQHFSKHTVQTLSTQTNYKPKHQQVNLKPRHAVSEITNSMLSLEIEFAEAENRIH